MAHFYSNIKILKKATSKCAHRKCMRNDEELKVVEVSLQVIYDIGDGGFGP